MSSDHKPDFRDETILRGSQRTNIEYDEAFDHSKMPLEDEEYEVIIIGSSMVGMSLGALLGYHGVKSLSFDRHPSTAIHPRAALFLLRTIEIFRKLGIADIMEKESVLNFDLDAGMLLVESLVGGKVLMRMQESDPAKTAEVTPCRRLWLTQNMFEPLLRREAKRFDTKQQFSTRVVHYEEGKDGVIVVVQDLDTKQHKKYKTKYLVATDGNRSPVRRHEDIEWRGPGVLNDNISINFKADLTPYLGSRAVHGVTYINNPKVEAGFRLEGGGKAGFMIVSRGGDKKSFEVDSVTADDAKQYFYDASGIDKKLDDLEIDSISYWTAAAFVADSFTSKGGRIFIAGDAAHVMPPTGGMGGNTGIQDTFNLAWKLAYVLKGEASPNLLKTYNQERIPTATKLMGQAHARYVLRVLRDPSEPHDKELADIICELGPRYPEGAFILPKGTPTPEAYEDPYAPSVAGGSRAPHVMLTNKSTGDQVSTLDLFKRDFVLFTTSSTSPWLEAATKQKIKIEAYGLTKDSSPIADLSDLFAKTYKLGEDEAILIRPDGIIAWRGTSAQGKESETLVDVLQKILWE